MVSKQLTDWVPQKKVWKYI